MIFPVLADPEDQLVHVGLAHGPPDHVFDQSPEGRMASPLEPVQEHPSRRREGRHRCRFTSGP